MINLIEQFNPLGLGEPVRQRLAEMAGMAPELCWLPTDNKQQTWRSTTDLNTLRRRPPMFITTTWHAPDPDNTDAMLHLADGIWIDIDASTDKGETIEDALEALSETVEKLEKLRIPLECCSLFASGGKGFHIYVPLALMCWSGVDGMDLKEARIWPRLCKQFVGNALATTLTDMSIYSGGQGRLFRQTGVRRDNALYKVPLAWTEWQGLTVEDYTAICSQPRDAIEPKPVERIATGAQLAWTIAIMALIRPKAKLTNYKATKLGSGGNLLTTDKLKIDHALKACCGALGYHDWIRVGMALKSTGASDALDLWIKYSRLHPKYKPGECEDKWNDFRGDVGLGTLYLLAKNGGRI